MFSADHVHPKNKGNAKCIYWPISAISTSFSTEIIRFIYFFIVFFLFSAVRKKAQNGTNGKKDTFFGLIFCFQKTKNVKNYFFAWSKLGAFGVILTMQLEPPKQYRSPQACTVHRLVTKSSIPSLLGGGGIVFGTLGTSSV